MLKYLCFIILGIVLFLLWNHINRFSIGNQYDLSYTGTDVSFTQGDPNDILKDLFNKVVNREEVCSRDFAECSTIMLGVGGDCQINTIVGLYGALNIPFSPDDKKYINSFGVNLKTVIEDVYDYLTNRPSMKKLLFQNNLDPQLYLYMAQLRSNLLPKNKLYPVYLGTYHRPDNKFTKTKEGITEELLYGHNLLMYKTDLGGLRSFVSSLLPFVDVLERRQSILTGLNASIQLLESEDANIQTNGNVCLMIDLCPTGPGKKFYAVTELDYPSTVASFDSRRAADVESNVDYNILWTLKLNIAHEIQFGTTSFNTTDGRLPELDLTQLNQVQSDPDDLLRAHQVKRDWLNDEDFRDLLSVKAYLPTKKDPPYTGDYNPQNVQLKPQTDFYGKLDRLCLDVGDTGEARCNDGLYCKEGIVVNSDSAETYDMCLQEGTEGTPCIRNTSDLYLWTFDEPEYWQCSEPQLYCKKDVLLDGSKINMCVERGTEGATCRDEQGNRCNPGLDCLIDYNSRDRNLCVNSRDIVLNSIPKIVFKEQDGVLIQINQSGLIYAYNPGFRKDPHMPYRYYLPSLNQLKQGIIYLGDYQKQSTGMSKRWQQRSFFLEWDNSRCYIMYCEPINRPTGSTGIQAFVTEGNIVLDIKDRLEIIHLSEHFPNFFQLGKNDATETDLYVTILLNDTRGNASKGITYLEISTSSRIDDLTPEYHLVQALNYVDVLLGLEQQKQQEEQLGLCSAIVAGVASQRFGDL